VAVRLTDAMRTRFLDLVSAKVLPMKAAKQLDLNWRGVRNYADANRDFADEWADARATAVEQIEERLWHAAEEGEPWAINKVLDSYAPEVFNRPKEVKMEIAGEVKHTLSGASADTIIADFNKLTADRIRTIEANNDELLAIDAVIVDEDTPEDKTDPVSDDSPPPPPWLPDMPPEVEPETSTPTPTVTKVPPLPWAINREDNDND